MQSRVYFPSERTCPPAILAGVRAVNPRAELLYAGNGNWLLGVIRFSWPAYKEAWNTLRHLDQSVTSLPYVGGMADENRPELIARAQSNATKRAYYRLALQGFRFIGVYRGDATGRIVRDYEYKDFEYRVFRDWGLDMVLEEALAQGDQRKVAKIDKLRQAIRLHGTSVYRYLGGQRHIQTHGSKGAAVA